MKSILIPLLILITFSSKIAFSNSNKSDFLLLFIHGANFKENAWNSVRSMLRDVKTEAINLPGRNDQIPLPEITLESSAKALCSYISNLDGKIILVGHSQAGAIINQALGLCDFSKIQSIVYIAAIVPLNNEKPYDLLTKNDEENYFSGIEFLKHNAEFRIYNYEKFFESFSQDSNALQRELIQNSSTSEPANIGNGVLNFSMNNFNVLKKYYVFTIDDKIISLGTQKNIAKRVNFVKTFQAKTGHLPMITAYELIAKILLEVIYREEKTNESQNL